MRAAPCGVPPPAASGTRRTTQAAATRSGSGVCRPWQRAHAQRAASASGQPAPQTRCSLARGERAPARGYRAPASPWLVGARTVASTPHGHGVRACAPAAPAAGCAARSRPPPRGRRPARRARACPRAIRLPPHLSHAAALARRHGCCPCPFAAPLLLRAARRLARSPACACTARTPSCMRLSCATPQAVQPRWCRRPAAPLPASSQPASPAARRRAAPLPSPHPLVAFIPGSRLLRALAMG